MNSPTRYCDYYDREGWRQHYGYLAEYLNFDAELISTRDSLINDVKKLDGYFKRFDGLVDLHNDEYVKQTAESMIPLLDRCGIPHNRDQREAAACDEASSLIVAGAGTGKTTTIQAKLAHLIHERGVKPSDILLMTFTRKASQELVERLERISPELTINTFHAFGYAVLKETAKQTPDILFQEDVDLSRFIDDILKQLMRDPAYCLKAVNYFSYYLHPVTLLPGFSTLDDYYHYRSTERILTFKKEVVKSQQEAMIANWLYLHGINYEYERAYEHNTADSKYRQYRPDFFLTDYGIYLEHFGIGTDGHVRFAGVGDDNAKVEAEYLEAMRWKNDLHKSKGTRLIATYSYEFSDGNWQELLEKKLKETGVRIGLIDINDIMETLMMPEAVMEITNLMRSFLNLFKSAAMTVPDLWKRVGERGQQPREKAFVELFVPVYEQYEQYLSEAGGIDFHDMLGKAASLIGDGAVRRQYRYLVVDEFQDISVAKYRLIMALRKANPNLKLYCVGDDWQSIFRFTGSDVSLMADFERFFGYTRRMKLEVSNRFCANIAEASNDFVLRNPIQIRKQVHSNYALDGGGIQVLTQTPGAADLTESVLDKLDGLAKAMSDTNKQPVTLKVFILGRFSLANHRNYSSVMIKDWQKRCSNLKIVFSTVHSAKGLTADFVIIIDVINGLLGFPCRIQDDPLLNIVLSEPEEYPFAEERRLMYVALTRARHKAFVLTQAGKESPFALELKRGRIETRPIYRCQRCGGRWVLRTSRFGKFLSCKNYPRCGGKLDLRHAPQGIFEMMKAHETEVVELPDKIRLLEDNIEVRSSG